MNADILMKHLDRISEAPDAVARLRRSILDLAVRGKLVEQASDDEPASELVKRIQAEKARLVKVGKARREGLLDATLAEQDPFQIPTTWKWIPATYPACLISDMGKKIQTKEVLDVGDFPVVDQGKVFIRGYSNDSEKVIRIEAPIVLFGDHTRETKLIDFDFIVGADGVKLLSPVLLLATYYFLALNWLPLDSRGYGRHYKLLKAASIPLPPLAEQHRIVAKVDELMALCDKLEAAFTEREAQRNRLVAASLHRIGTASSTTQPAAARFHFDHLPRLTTRVEHIKQLRQTILNLAVRGRLVPQGPDDEAVGLQSSSCDESSEWLPAKWRYVRLVDVLAEDTRNGFSKRPDDAPDGIPILRISAGTARNDGVVAEEEHKLISGIDSKTREQYRLKPGDLLACRFNGNKGFVGRLTIFNDYLGLRPIYPDKLIRVRATSLLTLPTFLRLAGDSDVVRKDIEAACATTVGNWGISAAKLKEIRFPLPPLAEQHRIVARVDELMSLCDQLETQITTTETDSRRLLEAVLRDALAPALEEEDCDA